MKPFAVALFVAFAAPAEAAMTGPEIAAAIEGRRIYLQVPLGGEFPIAYHAGGRMDGSGSARGLGVVARIEDEGRWWVDGDRLCQVWRRYENGRRFCFVLVAEGGDQLRWRRDDGLEGRARVGR
jgi:hypothetical protein